MACPRAFTLTKRYKGLGKKSIFYRLINSYAFESFISITIDNPMVYIDLI